MSKLYKNELDEHHVFKMKKNKKKRDSNCREKNYHNQKIKISRKVYNFKMKSLKY